MIHLLLKLQVLNNESISTSRSKTILYPDSFKLQNHLDDYLTLVSSTKCDTFNCNQGSILLELDSNMIPAPDTVLDHTPILELRFSFWHVLVTLPSCYSVNQILNGHFGKINGFLLGSRKNNHFASLFNKKRKCTLQTNKTCI